MTRKRARSIGAALAAAARTAAVAAEAAAPGAAATAATAGGAATVGNFSYGQLQSTTIGARGCGTNAAGEPAIHVSRADNVFLGSELGIGSGSQFWRGL